MKKTRERDSPIPRSSHDSSILRVSDRVHTILMSCSFRPKKHHQNDNKNNDERKKAKSSSDGESQDQVADSSSFVGFGTILSCSFRPLKNSPMSSCNTAPFTVKILDVKSPPPEAIENSGRSEMTQETTHQQHASQKKK